MSYCINPNCPKPSDPSNEDRRNCRSCGSELLLQGRYRVLQPLGGGGFGQTYEVDDNGNRKVLKVLLKDHPKAVALFQQEAAVLSQLRHPGIPYVNKDAYFTVWPHDSTEPIHCLIMEKIEGANLQDWLKSRDNQPITQALAIDWLKQLTEILDQVHQQNYFHRDIKPHNIMRRPNGQLVLIDFGTAREVTGTYLAKVGQGQNVTGIVSPGYTPPEQVNGKAVPQSDFFALGRTFVYLLTGKSPNEFPEDPRSGKLIWRDRAPHIAKSMTDIIDYLMAPFPGKRPQNAQMILQCLADLDPTMPLHAPTQIPQSAIKKDKERDRTRPGTNSTNSDRHRSHVNNSSSDLEMHRSKARPATNVAGNKRSASHPTNISTHKRSTPRHKSNNQLLFILFFLLLAGGSTQIYGYWRYGLFPANPIFLISSLPSSTFLQKTLSGNGAPINDLSISPDGQNLITTSGGNIQIWNLKTGQQLDLLTGHTALVKTLAVSPDSKIIVSGSEDKTIKIWDLKNGTRKLTRTGHTAAINTIAITSDGQTIVSGSNDKTIRIWDINGEFIRAIKHPSAILAVAISRDSQSLVTAGEDKIIRIWDLNTGTLRGIFKDNKDNNGKVLTLALSPDGKTLASGTSDNIIKLWQVNSRKLLHTLKDHSASVLTLAFSPDSKILASGSSDNTIGIFLVNSGKILTTFKGHAKDVTAVTFTSDGQSIVSGSLDQTVKIWKRP